jgi:large subunit ribosomal protein L22
MATTERQEVQAVAKWVRMSPRKARLVVEHIRGRTVPEARTVLAFTPRAAAREIEKVLSSAVANAEANHNLEGDDLVVSAAFVDEGPVLKRWRARARGRAARIRKPTCHITIRLSPFEDAAVEPARVPPTPAEPEPAEPEPEEPAAEETETVEETEQAEAEPEQQEPAAKKATSKRTEKTEEEEAEA